MLKPACQGPRCVHCGADQAADCERYHRTGCRLHLRRLDLLAGEIAELLGVDLPQLPLVLSAPQWLEEQALADGCFGLALGFTVHLGLPPFVTGSPVILDVLTNQLPDLTGGTLIVDTDVSSSADALEQVILEKRKALGI